MVSREIVATDALNLIQSFEEAASHPNLPKTAEEAKKIKALWVFSGPGTYDLPFKDDRYQNFPWAGFMDRRRLNRAGWLMRKITEIAIGKLLDGTKNPYDMRQAILENGPYLIYNGRPDENATVEDVLKRPGIAIPRGKVHVIDAIIDNTLDQVKSFDLPINLNLQSDDRIALVSHAPHLARVLYVIDKFRPFPEGVRIQAFPIATPREGKQIYAEMEIQGILYYAFVSNEASKNPYPHIL